MGPQIGGRRIQGPTGIRLMIEGIFELLTGVAAGGATGLLGTGLTGLLGFFTKRQANKQELALRAIDLEIARAEGASAERIAELNAESEQVQAEYDALNASYKHAMNRWTEGYRLSPLQIWVLLAVDVIRGLMRPAITIALTAMTGIIYFTVLEMTGIGATDTEQADIRLQIVLTILYLNSSTVLWWFGGREVNKAVAKYA